MLPMSRQSAALPLSDQSGGVDAVPLAYVRQSAAGLSPPLANIQRTTYDGLPANNHVVSTHTHTEH